MKKMYIKIVVSIFSFFIGFNAIQAQNQFVQYGSKTSAKDTAATTHKMSVWSFITQTPWIITVGPSLVDDDGTRLKKTKLYTNNNYYPIRTSAEKYLKKGLSLELVFTSYNLFPHSFLSDDLNLKYNFCKTSASTYKCKWFDPYVLAGLGHTFKHFPSGPYADFSGHSNAPNANLGGGINIWLFKNAGIFAQGVGKWTMMESKLRGSNYIDFAVGVTFKIGRTKEVQIPVVAPNNYKRTKEAQDAADYLRQIINK
jgi:hypothetical protein